MTTAKVVEYVDIEAPVEEVFALVINPKRRLQLSPLWGVNKITHISEDWPEIGSCYRTVMLKGDEKEYNTVVRDYQPLRKLAYGLDVDMDTQVTWTVQPITSGSRLVYEETYHNPDDGESEMVQEVRKVVKDWMRNIKRYLELRESRIQLLIRWLLDRYFLKLRKDQRNVIVTVLFMQAVGMISFIMAAIAMGIANYFAG